MPDTTETHGRHLTVPVGTCPSPGSPYWEILNGPYVLNFNKKQPPPAMGISSTRNTSRKWSGENKGENSFQTVQSLLPKLQSWANKANADNPVLTMLLIQGIRQCPEVASRTASYW